MQTSSKPKLRFIRKPKPSKRKALRSEESSAKKLIKMSVESRFNKSPTRHSKKSSLNSSNVSRQKKKKSVSRSKKRGAKSQNKVVKQSSLIDCGDTISIQEFQKHRPASRSLVKR